MANRKGTSASFWRSMEFTHDAAFGGMTEPDGAKTHVVPVNTPPMKATIADILNAGAAAGEKAGTKVRRYVTGEVTIDERTLLDDGFGAIRKEM